MPLVDPVPLDQIEDPALKEMIAQAEEVGTPDALFLQILAHLPAYAEPVFEPLQRSHFKGNVDHALKEIIRIQLARLAGDTYFANLRSKPAREAGLTEERIEAGCGDFENDPSFSEAEKWALRYGYWLFRDRKRINREFYAAGKKLYSEAEIMELGAFIAYHYGLQIFMRTLKAFPTHDRDGTPVSQEQSAKIYRDEVASY